MAAFNYKIVDIDSDDYKQLLRNFTIMFLRYRIKNPSLAAKPINVQYNIWWTSKGPMGFKTNNDMLRLKRELFGYIMNYLRTEKDNV